MQYLHELILIIANAKMSILQLSGLQFTRTSHRNFLVYLISRVFLETKGNATGVTI